MQDARRHGVEVRPPDVQVSDWDCTLEDGALRLGLRMVSGPGRKAAHRCRAAARERRRAEIEQRICARWPPPARCNHSPVIAARRIGQPPARARRAPLDAPAAERLPALARPKEGEEIVADYASLGLTLGRHPLALLRKRLARCGF